MNRNRTLYLRDGVSAANGSGVVPASTQAHMLFENYPNPFTRVTTIPYELGSLTPVRLTIVDLLGRVVEVLVDKQLPAGRYQATWSDIGVSRGIYFMRLEAGDFTSTGKLIVAG